VKCPRCGIEVSPSGKEWNYNIFRVKRFDCKKCKKAFMGYYRAEKLNHTIPKGK